MKKITLGFSILAAAAVFMFSCKKEKNTEIEPDKEFQSSIDISYAMQVISDIDMICSYAGENDVDFSRYFRHVPALATTPSVVTISRDTANEIIYVSFNNAICRDGHKRDGTISMEYKNANPNAKYYRDFAFYGRVRLFAYKVDDWQISLRNDFAITNLVAPVNYSPTTTNLSWKMTGDFDLKNPADAKKNMRCNVNFVKTLKNTAVKTVFPNKLSAINWSIAVCEYKGSMFGETSGGEPFKYQISDTRPMVRNFTCSPDKVYGTTVATNSVTPKYEMYTPFTGGVASFTTSTKYPRVIYYGSENPAQPDECDNAGAVMIKGISYPIDFKKVYK